jgi:hypothetical protein
MWGEPTIKAGKAYSCERKNREKGKRYRKPQNSKDFDDLQGG